MLNVNEGLPDDPAGGEKQLLGISARQIDRRLRAKKSERKRHIYGRTKPGSLLQHAIPVKSDSWDMQAPGFSEIDLVAHGGNLAGFRVTFPSLESPPKFTFLDGLTRASSLSGGVPSLNVHP